MTVGAKFKRRVRERMARTGESYTAAINALRYAELADYPPAPEQAESGARRAAAPDLSGRRGRPRVLPHRMVTGRCARCGMLADWKGAAEPCPLASGDRYRRGVS